ncbi:hypothetical protein TNCV_270901 [Trichonephila clavipes]|nr:hypothetical protein TNCV_270901 [Trichonephila clavipes]
MLSFLVLREGDSRNRWRDGHVCPDVVQGDEPGPGWRKHERRALVGTDWNRALRRLEWKGRKDDERRWR